MLPKTVRLTGEGSWRWEAPAIQEKAAYRPLATPRTMARWDGRNRGLWRLATAERYPEGPGLPRTGGGRRGVSARPWRRPPAAGWPWPRAGGVPARGRDR